MRGSRPPLPAPTVDMHEGLAPATITFPEARGKLLRDHGPIMVSAPSLCPGGCGQPLPMWAHAYTVMLMPERLLIVGCWPCTFGFMAMRGEWRRANPGRSGLESPFVVRPQPGQQRGRQDRP